MSQHPTLKELEQRYGRADRVPSRVLRQLENDPRTGAARLYRRILRRLDDGRKERARVRGMSRYERGLWRAGIGRVAGVDEVGLGPMAGPVVASAVVLEPGTRLDGVDDSKRLSPEQRDALDSRIRDVAIDIGVGVVEPADVDRLNVYHAGLEAMRLAVEALAEPPEHVLVDARRIPELSCPQSSYNKGDTLSVSIASASIIAKVYRDRLMSELDLSHPGYGFAAHKGYCTPEHQDAVRRLGPSPVHRRSYDFIREIRGEYSALFYELLTAAESPSSVDDIEALTLRVRQHSDDLEPEERRKLGGVLRRRRKRLVP